MADSNIQAPPSPASGAPSRRDAHLQRMRKKYPDRNFDSDEDLFAAISDDYDQFEKENGEMRSREEAFSNLFNSNPRSARLMMEWKDGKDPVSALIRIYGKEDILAAIDDPSRLEAIEEANREFAERVAKEKDFKAQFESNYPASCQAVDQWAEQNGIPSETVDRIADKLARISAEFIVGKFSPEVFDMILKAEGYDSDLGAAREEGRVAGRNEKISENLRQSRKGDGLQSLSGRNNSGGAPAKAGKSLFDLAADAL